MPLNLSDFLFLDSVCILVTTFLCSLFFYIKMRDIRLTKVKVMLCVLAILLIAIACQLLGGYQKLYIKVIYIISMGILLVAVDLKRSLSSVISSILSISISYALEYIGVVFSAIILYTIGFHVINFISTLLGCFIQIVLCVLISKIRIIKRGMFYLTEDRNIGLGLLISSCILIFSLTLSLDNWNHNSLVIIFIIGSPLALLGLILWIRSIVKRYYKNKLQVRMDEYTQKEMEDKDKRIERLEAEVTALAKQVHRDNHLMTSVDRSVQELAECDSAEQREQIVGEIHTLYLERNDSIAKEQQKNKILPSTGFALIDSSLSELYVKAAARGISFDLTVSEEPYYLVNNIISQTDLQTLLCDHIKDAIIAVESAGITDGRILVTIEKKDSIFEITIRDNGVDFDADTLARIGKEQVTTHADDGGSGIGFMTTFETLHKIKGSLIITEYEQKTPFSKSVAFVFDGLNRFVISTYRKEKLERTIDRDDVRIIVR